jgi:hypothetical protein
MKMIIDRKRYDTDTAEEIDWWWNGCSHGDFHHLAETLYRTKNGVWFLHGSGGALTQYAESLENGRSRCGGETLVPMAEEAAADWLARHNPKLFEKYFAQLATDA